MISNSENRSLVSNVTNSTAFGISQNTADIVALMCVLRDTLYTDKVLAVLREYSSNAWDAHRFAGKSDVPIEVTIPTLSAPALKIRDFGEGLSEEDVRTIFTQYGASTKRADNVTVGKFGLGSKSGFAYADNFVVTSYHGGVKRMYICVLDSSNTGTMNLVHEEPSTETGVEIQITVKPNDIAEFTNKARNLFRHYTPRPAINIDLPALPAANTVLVNGALSTEAGHGWTGIMGCVPYRINLGQLPLLPDFLRNISGSLYFDIGSVEISANREELKYSDQTKNALSDKFTSLVDEYVEHALNALETGTFTKWDMRLRVNVLNALDLPLPDDWKEMAEGHVKIEYLHDVMTIISNKSAVTRISVDDTTRLIIDDTGKDLKGYYLKHNDYVVRAVTKGADIAAYLDTVLDVAGLTGITIVQLSTLSFTQPYVKPKKAVNVKHRCKMFKFLPDKSSRSVPSDDWAIETRVALTTDVFVIIDGFKAYGSFVGNCKEDKLLAEACGVQFPEVYGYKSTEKKPVDPTTIVGIEYRVWRETFLKSLLMPSVLAEIARKFSADPFNIGGYRATPDTEMMRRIIPVLGQNHPLIELATRSTKKGAIELTDGQVATLARVAGITKESSPARQEAEVLEKKYPLLTAYGIGELWYRYSSGKMEHWCEYILLVDKVNP